jgi:hypothetical protein
MIQTSLRSSLSFVRASFCQGGYSWATYTTPYSGRGGTLPVDDFYTCAENKSLDTTYTEMLHGAFQSFVLQGKAILEFSYVYSYYRVATLQLESCK